MFYAFKIFFCFFFAFQCQVFVVVETNVQNDAFLMGKLRLASIS